MVRNAVARTFFGARQLVSAGSEPGSCVTLEHPVGPRLMLSQSQAHAQITGELDSRSMKSLEKSMPARLVEYTNGNITLDMETEEKLVRDVFTSHG